jgi:hypothetical protein
MELVQPAVSWRLTRYLNVSRELVATMWARTPRFGSLHRSRPSQIVSAMSEEWMREFERFDTAHGNDGR